MSTAVEKPELQNLAHGQTVSISKKAPEPKKRNEDAILLQEVGPNRLVLAVADGLGGLPSGDQAAQTAVDTLGKYLKGAKRSKNLRSAILDGIEEANNTILSMGAGAGTTLSVVEIDGDHIRPYHIGDSLILLVGQQGKLKWVSTAHSPVGFGLEAGLLDEVEAMHHKDRHLVSNIMGSDDMRIELGPSIPMGQRDTLLLATDGLSDNLHIRELKESIRKGPLGKAGAELFDSAQERMASPESPHPSKPDDCSFIVFRLKS